jgi:nitrous oxide reductase accessory protein NosL
MKDAKYVWIVMDGGFGANIVAAFDNEQAARKYANDNATGFSGFDGKYALPVIKKQIFSS